MKERDFRNKITWFTFLFSLLVVWVHSYNAELYLGISAWSDRIESIERFVGETVAQIAVPGFFMISSYLFFRGFSMGVLKRKWTSRIRSVLVPYIVWNTLYYLGYAVGSRLPVVGGIIGKGTIPLSLPALIDAIIHFTYNYVFWYLYQLILLIVLAPVIYLLVKKAWIGFIYLGVLLVSIYLGAALPELNLDALFYYSAAAFAAVHGKSLVEGKWDIRRGMIGCILIVAGILVYGLDLPGDGAGEIAAVTVLFRFLCPAGLWLLWPERRIPQPKEWMENNFFLYAVHFAIVRLINKTGALLLPPLPWIPLVLFFAMPALIVWISAGIGRFLRSKAPTTWRLLNGGR